MNNKRTRTIAAVVTCGMLLAITWTTFILAGSSVQSTAERAKEAVTTLKVDGCDPVQGVDRRVIVRETELKTRWDTLETFQQELKQGQRDILEILRKD